MPRPAIVLEGQGIRTTCREYSATRDDAAKPEQKVHWEMIPSFGPIHDACKHNTSNDMFSRCKSVQ